MLAEAPKFWTYPVSDTTAVVPTVIVEPGPCESETFVVVTEQEIDPRSKAREAVFGGVVVISTVTVAATFLFLRGVTSGTASVPDTPPEDTATVVQLTVPGTSTSTTSR